MSKRYPKENKVDCRSIFSKISSICFVLLQPLSRNIKSNAKFSLSCSELSGLINKENLIKEDITSWEKSSRLVWGLLSLLTSCFSILRLSWLGKRSVSRVLMDFFTDGLRDFFFSRLSIYWSLKLSSPYFLFIETMLLCVLKEGSDFKMLLKTVGLIGWLMFFKWDSKSCFIAHQGLNNSM